MGWWGGGRGEAGKQERFGWWRLRGEGVVVAGVRGGLRYQRAKNTYETITRGGLCPPYMQCRINQEINAVFMCHLLLSCRINAAYTTKSLILLDKLSYTTTIINNIE